MKKKSMIIVGIGFGISNYSFNCLLVLKFTTDIFKPTNELFQKFLKKNIEQINNITDLSKEKEYLNTLKQSNYRDNTKLNSNYKNSQGNTENFNIISKGITNNSKIIHIERSILKYGENFDVMNVRISSRKSNIWNTIFRCCKTICKLLI